jgi:Helicase HerA, central domain
VRRPATEAERQVAEWNLHAVDVAMLPGRPEIWRRPNPPLPTLQMLSVIGDARDVSCAFRLPVAVEGVVPGFKVRGGRFAQEEAIRQAGPAIRIGTSPGADSPVELSVRSLTKHALVVGSTGSGKTTTVLEILRQLWTAHRVPFLVIEPVNSDADDYRKLALEPGFEALEVITVGDEGGHPLRFNPFEVPHGVLVGEHLANLLACFKAAFGLWEPLPSIYSEALSLTYLRAGFLSSERSGQQQAAAPVASSATTPRSSAVRRWPTAVEFMRAMREVTKDLGYAGEVKANIEAASIRRAQQLVYGVTASAFLTTSPNDLTSLLDHPVILELKALGSGDEQALMMALLLNAITEHYQSTRGASADLVHVTVVEEAHRLLARQQGGKAAEEAQAKEKAAEAFANTLAENRKYGEGVIIAEQLPTKLVPDAVKNTNLKILHRLTAEDDRKYVGETMGFDDSQLKFATRLQVGEALTYSDEIPEAQHITITPTLRQAAGVQLPPVRPSAAPPFTACALCRVPCHYRGAGLAMVGDPVIVGKVRNWVAALEVRGLPAPELAARWQTLLTGLKAHVATFPALPSDGPGQDDVAFCLFLHAMAVRTTRSPDSWPRAVAQRLGIGGSP